MKLITRDTDYAARALIFMVSSGQKRVSVTDIVKALKIPKPFLRKVLQILNKNGIIESHKGKGGGFVLARKADAIFLVELIEIFQGPLKLNECLFKKRPCPERFTCGLNKKLGELERYVINKLKTVTIASLADNKGKRNGKKKHN